jgi:hypothetical protein
MNEKLGIYNSFSRKLANPAEGRKDDIYFIRFKLEFESQPPSKFSS